MQVISAFYKPWSDPPSAGSDVPERGVDLTVTVQGWPVGYTPDHIVYDKRKSLSATIADTIENEVVITGRIIKSSALLKEKSERVNLSNRLVFRSPGGQTDYIEIGDWQRNNEE